MRRRFINRIRLLLAAATLLVAGCGASSFTVGRRVLASVATTEIAAGRAWSRADEAQERKILDDAKARGAFREDVQVEIAAWRTKSDKVDGALDALAEATLAAKMALDAAEAANGKFDVAAWIGPVYHAALALELALRAAGVELPLIKELLDAAMGLLKTPPAPPGPSPETRARRLLALAGAIGGA